MNLLLNFINTITMPIRYFSSWIARIVPGLKKLASISLAARVALTSFLFLLIVVTTFLVIQKYFSESGSKELWKWIAAFGLVFLLPCFVYWLVRVWSIKDVSRFPELERVFEEGVDLCRQQGIDLMQVPIFLVLGAENNDQARQTMQASQLAFPIIYPQENADIAFFANNESLFLYVPGCSALSGLATAPMQAVTVESSSPASGSNSQTPFGGTIDASMLGKGSLGPAGSANAPSQPGAGQNTGTIQADGPLVSSSAPAARPPSTGFQGTILLPENGDLSKITGGNDVSSATASRSAPVLSSKEAYEREQKLRHLCRLIVKARQNLCPINGLLTLLPFQLIENASGELQAAAQKELAVLRDELQVRCANTVMVTGLEKEVGFTELIKRVGEQRAKEFRFGKG
ncbi:MAG: hypothetical protein NXI32_27810, partial [bacterium]|nr:hypothetical protein [bacterium]